jgi:hypothetical protein
LLGGQGLEVWQEGGGFGVAAHLGEVVDEVVSDAEEKAGSRSGSIRPLAFFSARMADSDSPFSMSTPALEMRLRPARWESRCSG